MRIAFGSPYRSRRSFGGYRRGSGGGGGWGRLIIGGVIALIALASFFFATDVNPFTKEKQRVGNITEEMEVQMGLQAAPQMAAQMGGVVDPRTDPRAALVHAVGQRLLEEGGVNAVLQEHDVPYRFSFTLLDDEQTVNAFALPGGPTFITEALFNRLENEAQLAGVIGHEIGHVINRHGAERIAKSQLGAQLVGAVAVGASGEEGGGYSAAMIANVVNQMVQLKYSREDELESDTYGLQFLVDAGYDPREMVRVMEILQEAGGGGGPSFMQSHPHPESRIEGIRRFVQEKFTNGVPSELIKGRPLR